MSNETKALSVARAYHRAWTSKQFDEAANYLADGLRIEVPINSYPTKASFAEAVHRTCEMTSKVEMLAEFGNDGDALLLYDMTLPFGQMRVAEHFTVSGEKITRIRQIHDTAAIRSAMGR